MKFGKNATGWWCMLAFADSDQVWMPSSFCAYEQDYNMSLVKKINWDT